MIQDPIEETIQDGEIRSTARVREETVTDRAGDRPLPAAIEERIAKLTGDPQAPAPAPGPTDDPADAEPDVEAEPAADDPAEPAPTPVEPPAADPEIARLTEANAKLAAELEAARASKPAGELPPHVAALRDAADSYLDDDVGALRAMIATAIGAAPDSKDVDQELSFLIASLTAKELGVTPDPSHTALRENARTRQLLARQKRERQAEGQEAEQRAKAEATAHALREATTVIGSQLTSTASEFPLLMAHAQTLDGSTPAEVVSQAIRIGLAAGHFDPATIADDRKLVAAAAARIEAHYRKIASAFAPAGNPAGTTPVTSTPSTVTTPSAQAPAAKGSSAKSATATPAAPKSPRTLTNADASVAPATPAKPATKERPAFRTDAERREYALRHLPK